MPHIYSQNCPFPFDNLHPHLIDPYLDPLTIPNGIQIQPALFHRSPTGQTDRQTDKSTHMARCVTFAVARIRVIGEILHIFPSGTESMGYRGSRKAYTGARTKLPTKFGCDRSIVVGCRSRNDRQTSRQTEWNDNKAHSLRT